MHKKENIFDNIDFTGSYSKLTELLKNAVERYWECEINLNLFAINDFKDFRDEYFIKNTDFFSSRIRVEHHKPILIKLDSDFIVNFLDKTLESKNKTTELKNLTPLEVKILNNFCEYLYRQISEFLIPAKQIKLSEKSEKNINFIIFLNREEDTLAKIVLSIPQDRINMLKLEHEQAFSDEDFINSTAYVKIRAGYAKLTLEELQNLNNDDIIVLDNSSINKLTLISGDVEKDFRVEVDKSLILKINSDDEEQDKSEYEVKMEKNLWDDIQIELSAEFSKVKMTIGELKQITKGQIVDLGSVFNNEILLYIENKKVAKGELLIINDKYAVRLNEVLSSNVVKATPEKKEAKITTQKKEPQPQKTPEKTVEDEEFDYSDFEN